MINDGAQAPCAQARTAHCAPMCEQLPKAVVALHQHAQQQHTARILDMVGPA